MSAHAGEERLGRYRLRQELGEGGMGIVYLASDPDDRPVAIKVLRQGIPAEATARRRLAREVETMRRVHSPFVAEVIDADVEANPPYIVTRYVPGRTLEDVVAAHGPLTGVALARLARGLAAGLMAVHSAGVVHRDLKPGNVMLVDGEPVVIDFGIAQAPDATRLTLTGMFMGTPGYLAPEVIEGRVSGPAADVHSWGATLAYAATARPPFGTGQFETIFYRIVHGQPDLTGLSPALLPLVASALARDPGRRPSAAQLAELTGRLDPDLLVPGDTGSADGVAAAALSGASAASSAAAGQLARTAQDLSAAGGDGQRVVATGGPGVAPPAWPGAAADGGPGTPDAPGVVGAQALDWSGTRPLAAVSPDDFADLLTPVHYRELAAAPHDSAGLANGASSGWAAPPGGVLQQFSSSAAAAQPLEAQAAAAESQPPSRLLLVLATLAGLIAVSVLLPVAGAAAALVVLTVLVAADTTSDWLGRRRRRHGSAPRQGDIALALAFFPWAILRSILRFLLLAPLALVCAGGAAALAVLIEGPSSLPRAGGLAAGALVACYCLGPGSRACRRPLNAFYGSLTRSPLAAISGGIGLTALAAAAVFAAATLAPGYWPAVHLGNQLQAASSAHSQLLRWPGNVSYIGGRLAHWVGQRLLWPARQS